MNNWITWRLLLSWMKYVNRPNTVVLGQNRMARILFQGISKDFYCHFALEGLFREWGYPDIPHQPRGLVGQNRGNGANRTVTGDISIPRYLYLPPIGNQRKSTSGLASSRIGVSRAQRLTASMVEQGSFAHSSHVKLLNAQRRSGRTTV